MSFIFLATTILEDSDNGEEEEDDVDEKPSKELIADEGIDIEEGEEGEEEGEEDVRPDEDEEDAAAQKPKKMMNMFNYCERAALTYMTVQRHTEAQTIPPPRDSFSGQVHQWAIYDALAEDNAKHQKQKEKKTEKKGKKQDEKKIDKYELVTQKMSVALNILERMVNQNTYNDIAQGTLRAKSIRGFFSSALTTWCQ